jgi:hypothetical protein
MSAAISTISVNTGLRIVREKAKRERPADGGLEWKEELNAFFCWGCQDYDEIRKRADREPEKLASLHELLIIEHTECWEFDDPEMARQARKHRKEQKRRENLSRAGLGAQRVSWRGR